MNITGFISMAAVALLISVTILLGSPLEIFVNIPALVVTLVVALGIQMIASGRAAFGDICRPLLILAGKPGEGTLRHQHATNLRALARHLYAAGLIGLLIGCIQVLNSLDDPSQLGPAFAVLLLTLFYAVLLAECVVRPSANRIDYLLGERNHV